MDLLPFLGPAVFLSLFFGGLCVGYHPELLGMLFLDRYWDGSLDFKIYFLGKTTCWVFHKSHKKPSNQVSAFQVCYFSSRLQKVKLIDLSYVPGQVRPYGAGVMLNTVSPASPDPKSFFFGHGASDEETSCLSPTS